MRCNALPECADVLFVKPSGTIQFAGILFEEAQHYLGKPANSLPALTGRLKSSAGKINKRIIK
jgi:hypothetical protein